MATQAHENMLTIIREMQIKTRKYHLTLIRILAVERAKKIVSVGVNAEKLENLCIVGGNINGAGTMVNSMEIPQKLKRLLYDIIIAILSVYLIQVK